MTSDLAKKISRNSTDFIGRLEKFSKYLRYIFKAVNPYLKKK